MTDEQFERLMQKLGLIEQKLDVLNAKPPTPTWLSDSSGGDPDFDWTFGRNKAWQDFGKMVRERDLKDST